MTGWIQNFTQKARSTLGLANETSEDVINYEVTVLDKTINLHGSNGNQFSIHVPDIFKVLETTVDLITQDEIVLTVLLQDGSGLAIPDGIGPSQFQLVLDTLEEHLPGFKATEVIRLANENSFQLTDEVIWERM